ncbi:MAG: fibronectin type III domain-containing protein [Caldilineaceae bacterium]|nr:fibronectin type III domain-containing protein [Caldilineaceae bacterium]MDE0461688.1 fibronectin type III domain-containing protein [Caldilineaceae bacterium]MDE0462990.1 fibronectin type III domain-containing protein [Caldilineaceae bacterium]
MARSWVVSAILIVIAILHYPNLVSAQQDATLSPPTLTAQAEGNSVVLSWNAVEGATRYDLFVWRSSLSRWQQIGGNSLTGTSFTHTNVAAGTTYWYTIRAVNDAGEASEWSAYASVTARNPQTQAPTASPTVITTPSAQTTPKLKQTATPTVTPTAAPTIVRTSLTAPTLSGSAKANGVQLNWSSIPGATRYDLFVWRNSLSGWRQIGGSSLTGTSFAHTNVTAGTTYWYTVRAVNDAGEASEWSEYATVTTRSPQTQAPTASPTVTTTPTAQAAPNLKQTATPTATSKFGDPGTRTETIVPTFFRVEDSIIVSWDAPAIGPVSHYILTRTHDENGATKTKTVRLDGTSTSYVDEDVEFFSYDYLLTAYLEESTAAATPTAAPTASPTVTTTPTAQTTPVLKQTATLTVTPTAAPTTVRTSLTAPTLSGSATANGVQLSWSSIPGATRYDLFVWRDSPSGWRQIGGNSLTGTSYTHTNVTAGTTYWYTVRAVNDAGETSEWSEYATVTTRSPQTQAPTASPTVTITPTAQAAPNLKQTTTPTAAPTASPTVTVTPTAQAAPNLKQTATPTVTPTASPTTVRTSLTAPTLSGSAIPNGAGVQLSWSAIPGADRYDLFVYNSLSGWRQIGGSSLTGTSYTHTSVTAGTTYQYTVRAVNDAGETGPFSSTLSVTVPAQSQ